MPTKTTLTLVLSPSKKISVVWARSRIARALRLSMGHGQVRISTPLWVAQHEVESFLAKQRAWIEHHLSKSETPEANSLLYLGVHHALVISHKAPDDERVFVQNHPPLVRIHPVAPTTISTRATLERWLQRRASEVCAPLLTSLAREMDVTTPSLQFRETRSRWGSCSSQGSISLNWRLIHAPLEIIRYVVVHELAHRKHMNHSASFWKLVEEHDPDFRVHRGWLKRNGHLCRTPVTLMPK